MGREGAGMTDEHQFGSYTQAELEFAIREAIKAEQRRSTWLILIWSAIFYCVGVIAGMLTT